MIACGRPVVGWGWFERGGALSRLVPLLFSSSIASLCASMSASLASALFIASITGNR